MAGSSMDKMLRDALGPEDEGKDPRKLLANVWIIRDEHTGNYKFEHPWVMVLTKHPINPPWYRVCIISSDKRNDLDVYLDPGTIEKYPGKWRLPCYIQIGGGMPRGLGEHIIDKGKHKLDLPKMYKEEILYNLSTLNQQRKYRKDSSEKRNSNE